MTSCTRFVLGVSLLVTVLVGATRLQPDWVSGLGLDGCGPPDARQQLEAERQRAALLDRRDEVVRGRLEAKTVVVGQLLDGRLTLAEAAAWFKSLNESPADYPAVRHGEFPGASEGERLCRQVINWVEAELGRQSASQAEAISVRLEEELQTLLRRDGTVHLPQP
jgi:hypothetical protein